MAQEVVVGSIISSTVTFGAPIVVGVEQYIALSATIASTVVFGSPFILEDDTLGRVEYTAVNLYPAVDISSITVDA